VSFRRENLARLAYAAAHPDFGFGFAKMYYSRATDRLYGRVTRLFLAPLLQAVVRFAGHQPLLDFLRSFRYPLAGEVAIDSALAAAVPFNSSWGVEIGLLTEIFRQIDPRNVAQVDGGGGYEHRHHPAAEGGTLSRMVREISQTLLVALQQEGCGGSEFNWHMIRDGYLHEAKQAVRRSSALARINGFAFDEDAEAGLVEIFGNELLAERSIRSVPLPSWSSLQAQRPTWVESFDRAVAAAP
jgi:glucosyl-3-phosphoglycerate synthase